MQDLAGETLVSTSDAGRDVTTAHSAEHSAIAGLCADVRSVAEVAALLALPLGVARVLLAEGDRDAAAKLAREAWRSDEFSEATEADAYQVFGELLTREDHRARMDRRIGARDLAAARRAAQRLGSDELAIVKACSAVRGKDDKA